MDPRKQQRSEAAARESIERGDAEGLLDAVVAHEQAGLSMLQKVLGQPSTADRERWARKAAKRRKD
jgi:hypothetical protein